jgi:hypothetical protein
MDPEEKGTLSGEKGIQMRLHRAAAGVGAIAAALAVTVPNGYSATAGLEGNALGSPHVAAAQHRNGVPFTGLDLALILGGGGGLIAAGAGLRRAAPKRT